MTPLLLLASLRERGFLVCFHPRGGLDVQPRSQLTPEDVALIREHREGILDALWEEIEPICVPEWPDPRVCVWRPPSGFTDEPVHAVPYRPHRGSNNG